jgi:hypothetical protein
MVDSHFTRQGATNHLEDELSVAAEAATGYLEPGEELAGVMVAEPTPGVRVYVCAYAGRDGIAWLVIDGNGSPIGDRALVRDAVSILGLCELAEESAGGGDLAVLRARLAEVRATEHPGGIEAAEEAAAALASAIAAEPRLASPGYLDAIGTAAAQLERALGEIGSSPFAQAMQAGAGAVEELAQDVERAYKRPLS